MDALKAIGLCALLASPPQTPEPCGPVVEISSPAVERWQTLIAAAAKRFDIPEGWIRAVMARESAGRTMLRGAPIVSRTGAMGLMQLMPGTWYELRARYSFGNDPFDPHDNVFAGTAYLREMFDRYGYPDLFAAYHAGPGHLDAVLAGVKPLPEATRTYLESIGPGAEIGSVLTGNRPSLPAKSALDSLFFVRRDGEMSAPTRAGQAREAQRLFVPLAAQPPSPAR